MVNTDAFAKRTGEVAVENSTDKVVLIVFCPTDGGCCITTMYLSGGSLQGIAGDGLWAILHIALDHRLH
jgi:hypothetical protein